MASLPQSLWSASQPEATPQSIDPVGRSAGRSANSLHMFERLLAHGLMFLFDKQLFDKNRVETYGSACRALEKWPRMEEEAALSF